MTWLNCLIFLRLLYLICKMGMIVCNPQGGCEDSMGMYTRCLEQSPEKSDYSSGIFLLSLLGEEVQMELAKLEVGLRLNIEGLKYLALKFGFHAV